MITVTRPFHKHYAWNALNTWGEQKQLDQAEEELLELVLSIKDYKRDRAGYRRSSIIEEMADVYLMLDQLREIFLIEPKELNERMDAKVARLNNLLENFRVDKG